jgi:hypothetical protein
VTGQCGTSTKICMNQTVKLQLQLAGVETLLQLFGEGKHGVKIFGYNLMTERRAYAIMRLKDRWYHMQVERRVMKLNLDKFWYPILRRDGKCLRCGATTNLQVDHIWPLFLWGKTEWNNLQTLCGRPCNQWKGKLKIIDFRPAWVQAKWPLPNY